MKIITVCGSYKFKEEMTDVAIQVATEGNVVLTPIFPTDDNKESLSDEQIAILGKMHKEKIKMSDAILVVNVNGHIGNATKNEIEYAKSLNKEIIYIENENK